MIWGTIGIIAGVALAWGVEHHYHFLKGWAPDDHSFDWLRRDRD